MPSGRRTIISVMPDAVRARSRRIPGSSVLSSGKCVRRRKVFRGRMSTGRRRAGRRAGCRNQRAQSRRIRSCRSGYGRARSGVCRALSASGGAAGAAACTSAPFGQHPAAAAAPDSPAQPHCIISIVRQKGSVRRVGNRPMSASSPVSGRTITTCSSAGTESDSRANPA